MQFKRFVLTFVIAAVLAASAGIVVTTYVLRLVLLSLMFGVVAVQ